MKKDKKFSLGPVLTIMIMIFVIALISAICSILQVRGDKTSIVSGTLETSVISVHNIFSREGFIYIFSNSVLNLRLFEPLFLLIISLIGIGIGEKSGLFKIVFLPFRKVKLGFMTVLVLFISIISTVIGDYSFAILLPFVGVFYKYAGKNPLLGILTAFLGIVGGYAAGFIPNFDIYSLNILTQASARVDVDKNYVMSIHSSLYIMFTSVFIITALGTLFILKFLEPKLPKVKAEVEEDLIVNKNALVYSNFTFILMLIILIYGIVPGIFGSGFLLDKSADSYIVKLLGENSPFRSSLIFIITIMFMICGYIYGRVSGNIKNSNDYSVGLSKSFDNLGYVFVLTFFASEMIGILSWTNLGDVIATNLVNFISSTQFSGIPLILTLFFVILIIGIIMPGTTEKWILFSPTIIPLFMRANITPEFTQFIFQVADGLAKGFTPLFGYFIIMIAFLEKYNTDENEKITIFGTLKVMLPTMLMIVLVWLIIIIGWYIVGFPLGPKGVTTL